MMWKICLGTALAALSLAQQTQQNNQTIKNQPPGVRQERLDAFTAKLNLNEQQKTELRNICTSFDEKAKSLDHQLWSLCDQERAALLKVLNDEQRSKVPQVFKEARKIERDKIATRLGLSADEKQRIEQVCEKFEPKFHEIAKQQGGQEQMHQLRQEVFAAIRGELNEQQRAKLPGILREEFLEWHDPVTQSEHMQAIADKLQLSADQQQNVRQILSDFNQKLEQPRAQLRQLCQEELTAVERVLNEEQRSKLREMLRMRGKG